MEGSKTESMCREMLYAVELVKLGARSGTIMRLVDVGYADVYKLYTEITNGQIGGRKGKTIQGIEWYLHALNCLHASAFYTLYQKYREIDSHPYVVIKNALEHYKSIQQEKSLNIRIDIDRAAHLVSMVRSGELKHIPCSSCGGMYVVEYTVVNRLYVCPVCRGALRRKRYWRKGDET